MVFSGVTERGSGSEKVSDTSFGISPSAAITVGKIAFLLAVTDNTPTTDGVSTDHTGVADTDGHTWTKVFERTNSTGAAADGATASLWWTKVTSEIGTGDVVTLTIGTARTAKILGLFEVSVGAGNTIALAAGGSTFRETDVANPAALTLSGLASKEYLLLGLAGSENVQITWTEDADYTNVYAAEGFGSTGGGGATNVAARIGYRIATLTGDTFQPSVMGAVEHTMALLAFEEVSGGTLFTISPTGSITASGALNRQTDKALAGSATAAGSLLKLISKLITGTVTGAGTLSKTVSKLVTGSTTGTGALSTVKIVLLDMAGSTTAAGTLVKDVAKNLTGLITGTGTVAKTTSRTMAGASTPSGTLARLTDKVLAGSITGVGTMAKSVTKTLTGAITASGSVVKTIAKNLAGSITPSGVLTTIATVLRFLRWYVGAALTRFAVDLRNRWGSGRPRQ